MPTNQLLKAAAIPCNPLFYGWVLTVSWHNYLLFCLTLAIVLRILHSFLRALAVQRGDFPEANSQNTIREFPRAFRLCFIGVGPHKEHLDLWIPFVIQLCELAIYPLLLVLGDYAVIGAWIGVKTAGGWTGHAQSRTSFQRFLLFNLLTLLLAYWLAPFFTRLEC